MQRILRTLGISYLLAVPFLSVARAQGSVCAEGGGGFGSGSFGPLVTGWMVQQAGPDPDVVILGVGGADNQIANLFLSQGAQSATNLAVTSANANTSAVFNAISSADIVWMRGGDQWQYVNQWNGTLAEDAIRAVYDAGGAVGGTSAGCAVLGELIYDARNGTVFPDEALSNPFIQFITLTNNFLELTPGVIFDTHFTERGRLPRLAVLMARALADFGQDVTGIGVDDRTAFCIHPDGRAEVIGEGSVTILRRDALTREAIGSNTPPAMADLVHLQLTEGYEYDLNTHEVIQRPANANVIPAPSATPSFSATTLNGTNLNHSARGDVRVLDGNDSFALFDGALQLVDGTDQLARTIVSTRVWENTTFDENRVGGPQWGIHENPHFLALYLDVGVIAQADANGTLSLSSTGKSACLLDAHGMTGSAQSTYISGGPSVGPRQSVAIEGARLHLLPPGHVYDAAQHTYLFPNDFVSSCHGDGGDQMGCTNCPCGNEAAPGTNGGCFNSTGESTRLVASGSASIASADLRIEAVGLPALVSAVLTSGSAIAPANASNPCFGLDSGVTSFALDGLRCAVQGVLRHGVRPSNQEGEIGTTSNGWGTPNGFFNFGAFTAGNTRHFQIVHRDELFLVCNTGQNTSQATSVTFVP